MAERVTRLTVEVDTNDPGPARVTRLQAQITYADRTLPVRVTRQQVQVTYADRTLPVRVTRIAVQIVGGYPTINAGLLSGGGFYSADISSPPIIVATVASQIEPNPYAPIIHNTAVADMPPALAGVLGPQQEMIRKQHNITQAGDTTFPFDLILDTTPTQEYNLGAEGTFFTDWGIIRAIYVQFASVKQDMTWGSMPYGRLKNTSLVDWKVTNDLTKSNADWCVGFAMLAKPAVEGEFGWVVTSGPNIFTLPCKTPGLPVIDDTYVWNASGFTARNVAGRIIARQWGISGVLDPGSIFVSMEGPNDARLTSLFDADFTAIENAIQHLQAEIAALQDANPSGLADRVTAAEQAIALLQIALAKESAVRSQRDLELAAAINDGLVTVAQFNEYKLELNTALAASFKTLTDRLTADERDIAASKAITDQLDPNVINQNFLDINSTLTVLSRLIDRIATTVNANRPVLPLTLLTPPQFFWFDDGRYMYVEIQ